MASLNTSKNVNISQLELNIKGDLSEITSQLLHNKILFVQTQKFFEYHQDNVVLLKNTMDQLKKICIKQGGSIGRIGDDILVISPNPNVKLF